MTGYCRERPLRLGHAYYLFRDLIGLTLEYAPGLTNLEFALRHRCLTPRTIATTGALYTWESERIG